MERRIRKVGEREGLKVRILQFNMLANSLTVNSGFNCDTLVLSWEYRCSRLIEEILRYDPDVIGVEELDQINFPEILKALSEIYEGYYEKKIGDNLDGCAVFWKKARYNTTI